MSLPYHAWTHRPKALGGTDPILVTAAIPAVVMFRSETAQTIPNNTLTRLLFDTASGGGFAFSSDGFITAGNEFGAHDVGQTTTEYMWTYRAGLMEVGCWVLWEDGDYPKMSVLQQGGADGGTGPTGSLESLFGFEASADGFTLGRYDGPVANTVLAQNPVEATWVTSHHHRDMWDILGVGDQAGMFFVDVKQTSGSDKDVTGAKLTLLRWCDPVGFGA